MLFTITKAEVCRLLGVSRKTARRLFFTDDFIINKLKISVEDFRRIHIFTPAQTAIIKASLST